MAALVHARTAIAKTTSGKVDLREWWDFMVCSWWRWGFLLPIFTSAITSPNRLLFAGVSTVLRAPIPALTLVMVNAARDIKPHYNVLWTVRLCRAFRVEERRQRSLSDDRSLRQMCRRIDSTNRQKSGAD